MRQIILIIIPLLMATACSQSSRKSKAELADSLQKASIEEWNTSITGSFIEQGDLKFDSTLIDQFLTYYPLLAEYAPSINQFYSKRDYAYAWYDGEGLIEQAGNLADRMLHLQNEGLDKEIPYRQSLDSLMHETDHEEKTVNPTLELMLTAQYFAFAQMAWQGMEDDVRKKNDWFVARKKISYESYLDSLILKPISEEGLALEPVYRQYETLRSYLIKYRQMEGKEWPALVLDKKSIKPGDSSTLLPTLRERLALLGDLEAKEQQEGTLLYDSILVKAVKRFQQRHGLSDDGAIGPGTLTMLNVSPKERVRQIVINMERSRWVPLEPSTDYLAVNIPEFKLHVYKEGEHYWDCNVVVGKAVHKTVIFSDNVKYVVFSPYWNVPPSIVRNEIVPAMQRNSNYIAQHNMEITGYSNGLPIVRQKPGPRNSLGLVKFLFPNSYNIYLHDTPSKSLFGQDNRAFSHGCIRVSEPVKLAQFLLRRDSTWTDDAIDQAMKAGKERHVTLDPTVPVYIAYFTAFTDTEGRINFRKDIYNRDERLGNMLLANGK